jgi:hypothetical protein
MKNSPSLEQELQEVITKHTERESAAKVDDALHGFPFQVLFAADEKDNVRVTVRWPDDAPKAQSVRTIASMLHHVSMGHWKPQMVASVKRHGVNDQQTDVANEVLHEWGNATQTAVSDAVCVSPRNVFARKQQ